MKPGSATYSDDGDVAVRARTVLDRAAGFVARIDTVRREAVLALVELWPTAAWLAAGCRSPRRWLEAYTPVSIPEADRLVRVASLAATHPDLVAAIESGDMALGRAEILARLATDERRPFLERSLDTILHAARTVVDDRGFTALVRRWAELVDQELAHHHDPAHRLQLTQSLFGNGEIHASLSPSAFLNVAAAIEAFTQDPDPRHAPHQRSLAERRADALDDLAHHSLTHTDTNDHDDAGLHDWDEGDDQQEHGPGNDDAVGGWDDEAPDDEHVDAVSADDVFDGFVDRDELDEALADPDGGGDHLEMVRRRLRHTEQRRRRRLRRQTKARSGVTVNVHVDLHTLAGTSLDHLDTTVLRTEGWTLTEQAARRLSCDAALLATLFHGPTHILDANPANEHFTRAQRRALAARDRGCVFPACTRPARWCDAHHLHPAGRGGPSTLDNGALVCRFHHRLIHEHGWTLTTDHTGHWTATDPHGTTWTGRPNHQSPATTTGHDPAHPRAPDRPTHHNDAA